MITLRLVFLILAVVSFLVAAMRIPNSRVDFTAIGLLLWVLATIAG
jgi:hypothetical protein